MRRFTSIASIAGVLLLTLVSLPASASSQLDFGVIAPTSGSISFAGGLPGSAGTELAVTDVEVDEIVGLHTPANDLTVLPIVNGLLNFMTGTLASTSPVSWNWNGGGVIEIRGEMPSLGIGPDSVLMLGSVESAMVIAGGGKFKVTVTSFTDEKHDDLVDFYGLRPGTIFDGNLNLSFIANGLSPSGFESSDALSGDVVSTPRPAPLPASAWMGLLVLSGSALLGRVRAGAVARRH